ncbi:MAG: hypothetical protein KatS3mg031_0160 [Chitinophagales bacterium]|nr:MAG: hypothetical protein KatS3mg031_0160 [Chitinophagales bacterium]
MKHLFQITASVAFTVFIVLNTSAQNWQLKFEHTFSNSGMGEKIYLIDFDPANDQQGVMINRYADKIRYTTDGGQTWSDETTLSSNIVSNAVIQYVGPNTLVLAYSKTIRRSTDGGQNFALITDTIQNLSPYSIGASGDFIVIGGAAGYVVYSRDGGLTWTKKRPMTNAWNFHETRVHSATFATVLSHSGAIYYTTDAGDTWTSVNLSAITVNGNPVNFSSGDPTISVPKDETNWLLTFTYNNKRYLFRTTDAGATWTDITANLPNGLPPNQLFKAEIMNVFALPDGRFFATEQDQFNLFYSSDFGDHISRDTLDISISSADNNMFKIANNKVYYFSRRSVSGTQTYTVYTLDIGGSSTGIEAWENAGLRITAFPNPTQGQCVIPLPEVMSNVQARIFNMQGQEVAQDFYPTTSRIQLDIPGRSGLYLVEIASPEGTSFAKVIKE